MQHLDEKRIACAMIRRASSEDIPLLFARLQELPRPPEFGSSGEGLERLLADPSWAWWVDTNISAVSGVYASFENEIVYAVYVLPEDVALMSELFVLAGHACVDISQRLPQVLPWTWMPDFSQFPGGEGAASLQWQSFAELLSAWNQSSQRIHGIVQDAVDYFVSIGVIV